MRTDSNTVLSLTPSVPPKKAPFAKSSSANGAAFASDFNRAKEPKVSHESSGKAVSSAAKASSSASLDESTSVDKNSTSVRAKGGEAESALPASEKAMTSSAVSEKSGNNLQRDGEGLPAQDGLVDKVAVGADGGEESAMLTFAGLSQEQASSEELKSSVALKSSPEQASALLSDTESGTATLLPSEAAAQGAGPSAMSSAAVAGTGVLGLDTIKQTLSGHANKADGPTSKTSITDEAVIDLSAQGEDGELSWVLSQMDSSAAKAAQASVTPELVPDAVKAAAGVAVGVLAGVTNKEGQSQAVPSALLGSAAVSDEVNAESAEALLGEDGGLLEDGVLLNEPIELRKKDQEAMMGRMAAQIDGGMADDNVSGGLNSALHGSQAGRAALGATAVNVAAQNPPPNLAMNLPPTHPGWAGEMTQKVAWVARDGGHTAHIRLDPPELGSLTVKISVDSDSNAQVSFVAATPQARDLLEAQMGRLREMLAQQGMDLSRAEVDVSQQDASGAQERGNYRNNAANQEGVAANDELDDELIDSNMSYVSATGVDYYA
ncbi:flagellar hook-length control protein FliK [Marinomonas sp. M1K-6]|uniref:Flagellar hook-length control protein FliK n=1 Tax=Marinomonas profundi TaxID=2726122 RepID=A0A847QZN7_9GAMM|nr:flagellar hook-length control protein FliK [Marinomonas profundi]NLQ16541.1 flagellar hook-length control protein FliK [Marinomonas profundi]UDV03870.1 flagellar hook-length control protein FliK [Marinomonas profundi]